MRTVQVRLFLLQKFCIWKICVLSPAVFLLSVAKRFGLLSQFEHFPQRFEASEYTHYPGKFSYKYSTYHPP